MILRPVVRTFKVRRHGAVGQPEKEKTITKAELLRQARTKLEEARWLLDDAGEQRLSFVGFELVAEIGLVNDALDQAGSEQPPHP